MALTVRVAQIHTPLLAIRGGNADARVWVTLAGVRIDVSRWRLTPTVIKYVVGTVCEGLRADTSWSKKVKNDKSGNEDAQNQKFTN